MILAARFGGFSEVDGASWQDVRLALQHLAEERVGTVSRAAGRAEDQAFQKTATALRKG